MRGSILIVCAGILACGAAPAEALDVVFNGTVSNTCSLAIGTPGALTLSADGTILGSDQPLGIPAIVNIISLGANSITVGAPTRTGAAAGYDPTGESVKVAYSVVAGVTHAYGTGSSSFPVGLIPLVALTVNNEIVNPNGFAQGSGYQTTTVITCS